MLRVLAIDPSSNCGAVVMEFDKGSEHRLLRDVKWQHAGREKDKVVGNVRIKGDTVHPMDRAGLYAKDLMTIVHSYDPDVVVLEGYGFSKVQGVDTIVLQCAIGTILRYFLRTTLDTPYFEIPPTTLKKFITGKGNAKKDTIMMEVYKRWGYEAPDNDLADAYGLAMAAGSLFGYVEMPKTNTEALEKLHSMDLYQECASILCV